MVGIGFYNLENLFDTIHDEGKNDLEYLPTGSCGWDTERYLAKLGNMSHALADMGTDSLPGVGCAFIGVAEVENDRVLDDLVAQEPLRARGFRYIHYEGPDMRGIDVAALYNPALFTPERSFARDYVYEDGDTTRSTRHFLVVQGLLASEPLTMIVCHWPSRGAGGVYREWAGRQVRQLSDSIRASMPGMGVVVMGDMNDDPDDRSMAECLGARRTMEEVGDGDFYNPWWDILRSGGMGTLAYRGAWNLFDQVVMSGNLLPPGGGLRFHAAHVFRRDYLLEGEGGFAGNPLRTFAGGRWLNGYSDHLPVVAYLVRE